MEQDYEKIYMHHICLALMYNGKYRHVCGSQ